MLLFYFGTQALALFTADKPSATVSSGRASRQKRRSERTSPAIHFRESYQLKMSETEETFRKDTEGAEYLKLPGFHRRFTLPATVDHGALQVGYSDLGRQPTQLDGQASSSHPTILFMPGMYASRYSGALLDVIGKKIGVRILTVDRYVSSLLIIHFKHFY